MINKKKTEIQQKPIVLLEKVYKIYKRGEIDVVAIKNVQCKIYPGEISLIMGPSGSGKSTLLNLIGGIDIASSGQIICDEIHLENMDVKDVERFRENNVGFVFQFNNLIPQLTAFENIQIAQKFKNPKLIKEHLSEFGLYSRRNHYPSELSGGEQQKIAILIALASDPKIILLDEPTGELDVASKIQIGDFLRNMVNLHPDKCFIIVTHDHNLISTADKLFLLDDGKILEKSLENYRSPKRTEETEQCKSDNLDKRQISEKINQIKSKIKELGEDIKYFEKFVGNNPQNTS